MPMGQVAKHISIHFTDVQTRFHALYCCESPSKMQECMTFSRFVQLIFNGRMEGLTMVHGKTA